MSDIVQDWMFKAAAEIAKACRMDEGAGPNIHTIIRSYSPFKQDVAYMPVPRCDSCRHWQKNPKFAIGTCNLTLFDETDGWQDRSKARAIAVNQDEDLEMAILETTADFGCNQWSSR